MDARAAALAGALVGTLEAAGLASARGVGESKEAGSPESQCRGPASLGLLGWGARHPQMLPPPRPHGPVEGQAGQHSASGESQACRGAAYQRF